MRIEIRRRETRIKRLKRRRRARRKKIFRYIVLIFSIIIMVLALNQVNVAMQELMSIEKNNTFSVKKLLKTR